ncbi:MAG TPA: glycoside hydrolase family 57 protein [Candidatus Acidoferrales bacterium]|nr:glycoside hydrolase family 57 protein [Candidatus Acidoferrales bacterium]
MSRVHLVLLWHMHQPLYRDPTTNRYILPWTRLHALKDYWGMVESLREFPNFHATFNIVPSMAEQIEEYASGIFNDPWVDTAFKPAAELSKINKEEILGRAFQVNHENLMGRWSRFVNLFQWSQKLGRERTLAEFNIRDWCDLQLLSQLAWMDEEYLALDPVVSELARRGENFTEEDKQKLYAKQAELLRRVLPAYREFAERGQIEISTTPFFHPILPLLCDSRIARVANPHSPELAPPFRFPQDAHEQLLRARRYHETRFGRLPEGLWPSEGSVSDEVLAIAAEMGFRWFATDEGILGRTRNIGFWRDEGGVPENAHELYSPWRFKFGDKEIAGFFRDHYLSDLIGFVYSRMGANDAAADFHRRLRIIGEKTSGDKPATVSVILDGENAWEYYRGGGREFLKQLYKKISEDPEIRALTASEAIAAGEIGTLEGIFPGSWIDANFDIWTGSSEDIRAWELLRDARQAYAEAEAASHAAAPAAAVAPNLAAAYDSLLAAEGSDWCWWYGPEHGSENDREFDELYRKHLTQVYAALGREAPRALAEPIKKIGVAPQAAPPTDWLHVFIDGRVSSYFEWLGAGQFGAARRGASMHGQPYVLGELLFGFNEEWLFVRLDPTREGFEQLANCEFRFIFQAGCEIEVSLKLGEGKLVSAIAEKDTAEISPDSAKYAAAIGKVIEVGVAKELFSLRGQQSVLLSVSLWRGGLPIELLPPEGSIEIRLGEENFAWPVEPS